MLGLACAFWIAQGLLYFQFGAPPMVNPSKVRVSDEEVPSNLGRARTSTTCPITRGGRPSLPDVLRQLPEQLPAHECP